LYDLHIKPYEFGNQFNHDPRRPRKLLLHAGEIKKLHSQTAIKGKTLVPLSIYFNRRGKAKLEIAVCQGKSLTDKRDSLRQKATEMETCRALSQRD
ncbi:MAG: SsrA-binding protein, partial [Lentisphaerae bacterium]|nr:SsrA-binding protein [Lentisphaerota bacterium]